VTNDDLLYRHRLLVFARAAEEGVSRACQALGYHRSWFYRWKGRVEREGLEVLRPRERRAPRMPNQIPPWQETQILAIALANPGLGPRRLAAQLVLEQSMTVSASGVLRVSAGMAWELDCADSRWSPATRRRPSRSDRRHRSIATSKLTCAPTTPNPCSMKSSLGWKVRSHSCSTPTSI